MSLSSITREMNFGLRNGLLSEDDVDAALATIGLDNGRISHLLLPSNAEKLAQFDRWIAGKIAERLRDIKRGFAPEITQTYFAPATGDDNSVKLAMKYRDRVRTKLKDAPARDVHIKDGWLAGFKAARYRIVKDMAVRRRHDRLPRQSTGAA
jgi:hypothetical protein